MTFLGHEGLARQLAISARPRYRQLVTGSYSKMITQPKATNAVPGEITFGEIRHRLRSRSRLILVGTVASTLVGLALAFSMQPIYRAEMVLAAVAGDHAEGGMSGLSGLGGLASLAGVSIGQDSDRKVEALATLQSRVLTEAFINDEGLLPILFAERWDEVTSAWKSGWNSKPPTLWDGNRKFSQIRDVREDKKSGLITVSVEWRDPELARKWVTGLVNRTNDLLRSRAISRSESNKKFIEIQLQSATIIELRQALFHLIENEIKSSMLAQSSGDYAFKVIDPAVAPQERVRPKRGLILALAFLAGLMMTSLYALINPLHPLSPLS